jgi:hypothetical protein
MPYFWPVLLLLAETHVSYTELLEVTQILRNADFEGEDNFTRLHFTAFQEVWCY